MPETGDPECGVQYVENSRRTPSPPIRSESPPPAYRERQSVDTDVTVPFPDLENAYVSLPVRIPVLPPTQRNPVDNRPGRLLGQGPYTADGLWQRKSPDIRQAAQKGHELDELDRDGAKLLVRAAGTHRIGDDDTIFGAFLSAAKVLGLACLGFAVCGFSLYLVISWAAWVDPKDSGS